VVKRVDLAQVVAVLRLAASQLERIDLQAQPVEVLVRIEGHIPERKQADGNQNQNRQQNHGPALQAEGQIKKLICLIENIFHETYPFRRKASRITNDEFP